MDAAESFRPAPGRGRLARLGALLLVLASLAGCSSRNGAPVSFPGVPGGQPYSTVAWFDPASASVVVAGHDCGEEVRVQESGRIVRIGTFSLPTPSGVAVACADLPAQVVHLGSPLGGRPLVGLDGSPLLARPWRSRLHLPWTAGMDLRMSSPDSTTWIQSSAVRAAGASGHVTLTSRPADRTGGRSIDILVRGHRALAGCPVAICWDESGIAYQLSYSAEYPDQQVSRTVARLRAVAVAKSLGHT